MSRRVKRGIGRNTGVSFHRVGVLGAVPLVSLIVWLAAVQSHNSRKESISKTSAGTVSPVIPAVTRASFPGAVGEHGSSRPLYPYSIIPGGVENADELGRAVANDPVVRAHYAGFDVARAHIVRLSEARLAFVSYRKGNIVYWTSKRLSLPAGETLITDGLHTSRTRCGNQVSDVPRTPIAPEGEPSPKVLATPLVTWDLEQPPIDFPLEPSSVPEIFPFMGGGGSGGIPPYVPVIVGGSGGDGSLHASTPPASVPISTPEPGTLLLTGTSLCAAWLVRKRSKP